MNYSIQHIAEIIQADTQIVSDAMISNLLTDSRRVVSPSDSLFFALRSSRRDGRQFIPELYKKGVRNFVVMESIDAKTLPGANILQVDDTLLALQQLAAFHRRQFNIPVIGITGSNGKTIVKEWLYNLLHTDYNIVRSPKSYNSQIGVPVSVWQMNEQHNLAIFEAGISTQGEMKNLERIIQPTIGILTNILDAHSEGFNDHSHKFREKITLFQNCNTLIVRGEDVFERRDAFDMLSDDLRIITWGESEENDFVIREIDKQASSTKIRIGKDDQEQAFTIPFTDDASAENAITCYCLMRVLNISGELIEKRMKDLHPVNMRLEMKNGINHCCIINDSYSADLYSLNIALTFLEKQSAGTKRTVILSDFLQSGLDPETLYSEISQLLAAHKIEKVIGIGENIGSWLKQLTGTEYHFYTSTENFLHAFRSSQFKEETILVKGARIFGFEKIVQVLQQQAHQTVLEINLNSIANNLKEYQRLLRPETKIMAMVKAFAYGSGGAEIAGMLQFHKIDYLGVAYADEGVELRNAGINLPVMVMNPESNGFDAIIENRLEPEIYSTESFRVLDEYLKSENIEQYPVHIEIETGMNRLGFSVDELQKLAKEINASNTMRVQSVFTHLASSEDPSQDNFTLEQSHRFNEALKIFEQDLGYSILKHISNSAAIIRHPNLQMDMVRLGIGMYGVDSSGSGKLSLQTVATLRSTVAQVKHLKKGESVSYNRKSIVTRDSVIATVRIGYADGYPRRLGNGSGKMWVHGKLAPVIGTVCMDMTMIDVTDISNVQEGDEVIVFGPGLPIQQVAEWAGTIPYEMMTGISQRVKRVYFEE